MAHPVLMEHPFLRLRVVLAIAAQDLANPIRAHRHALAAGALGMPVSSPTSQVMDEAIRASFVNHLRFSEQPPTARRVTAAATAMELPQGSTDGSLRKAMLGRRDRLANDLAFDKLGPDVFREGKPLVDRNELRSGVRQSESSGAGASRPAASIIG